MVHEDGSVRDSEDEAEWDRLQADVKSRDSILDPKSKESHIVHAPYFPEVCILLGFALRLYDTSLPHVLLAWCSCVSRMASSVDRAAVC